MRPPVFHRESADNGETYKRGPVRKTGLAQTRNGHKYGINDVQCNRPGGNDYRTSDTEIHIQLDGSCIYRVRGRGKIHKINLHE